MSNRKLWKCKDGTKIQIRDMTDSHLINSIKLMERTALEFARSVPYPMFQGEMAQYYAEREFENLQDDPLSTLEGTIYDDLCEEAFKRNLEWRL